MTARLNVSVLWSCLQFDCLPCVRPMVVFARGAVCLSALSGVFALSGWRCVRAPPSVSCDRQAQLETSLLQWSDAGSTYTRLQRWISDREARLQQVLEHKPSHKPSATKDQLASLGEKKAALRRTNSIMQVRLRWRSVAAVPDRCTQTRIVASSAGC